ncbi:uncharacterized protein LOC135196822 [Macrobrachium nipponense]|uniref:uncharacterized protein LOC135196822 n=1 Tax=Macrobrachium nipponense TaxID=159736 RepID=UPI0030C864AA
MFRKRLLAGSVSLVLCLLLLSDRCHDSVALTMTFKRALKGGNLNIWGPAEPQQIRYNIFHCAALCATKSCVGFAWYDGLRACKIYLSLVANFQAGILVYPSNMAGSRIFVRADLNENFLIVVEPRIPTLTWDSAQAFCQTFSENLIYLPDLAQMKEVADFFGNLHVGCNQVSPSVWKTLNGTDATITYWSQVNSQPCLAFFKGAGYAGTPCSTRPDSYWPTTSLCFYTEP